MSARATRACTAVRATIVAADSSVTVQTQSPATDAKDVSSFSFMGSFWVLTQSSKKWKLSNFQKKMKYDNLQELDLLTKS